MTKHYTNTEYATVTLNKNGAEIYTFALGREIFDAQTRYDINGEANFDGACASRQDDVTVDFEYEIDERAIAGDWLDNIGTRKPREAFSFTAHGVKSWVSYETIRESMEEPSFEDDGPEEY